MKGKRVFAAGLFIIFVTYPYCGLFASEKEEVKELLAETYIASGQHDKAIEAYRDIVERSPDNIKALISLADVLSWTGEYDEALALYEKAISLDPDNNDAILKTARLHVWRGDLEEASILYEDVFSREHPGREVLIEYGEVILWRGKYERVLEILEGIEKGGRCARSDMLRARTYMYSGLHEKARPILEYIAAEYDDHTILTEAGVMTADMYAYTGQYKEAIQKYLSLIEKDVADEHAVKVKLADVLSWDRQYERSVELYSELLERNYDPSVHLQKARVLGWARKYNESKKEYRALLEKAYEKKYYLEYQAKKANWGARPQRAISRYRNLIEEDDRNLEAMFDLAQVYSYRGMLSEAVDVYDNILRISPLHTRARQAREKALMISMRPAIETSYRYFRAESSGRDTDIDLHETNNFVIMPLSEKMFMETGHVLRIRRYKEERNVIENSGKLGFSVPGYLNWSAAGHYELIVQSGGADAVRHEFGGMLGLRIFDAGEYTFNYEREMLENNREVVSRGYFRDMFRNTARFDITRRLKAGFEYGLARYSDRNFLHLPALDLRYDILLEPKSLAIEYRYSFTEFRREVEEYFSPKAFSMNTFSLKWRHFLNKEEIFFGGKDIYYGFGYDVSIDSENIAGHKFIWEANWDITDRFNFNVNGAVTVSSASVYKDSGVTAKIRYYF